MSSVGPDRDLDNAAAHVNDVIEAIFTMLREGATEAERLWESHADSDGRVATSRLAALRAGIESRLAGHAYLNGTGLVADPHALLDAGGYQEWWRPGISGEYEFLDVRTGFGEDPYDYTTMSWFVGTASGLDSVRGPYVDLAGSDLYVLTFAVPAWHRGRFIGASGADVTVSDFEGLVIGELSMLDADVVVVNSNDRIVVSNSAAYSAGERMRAVATSDTPIGGDGVRWRAHRIWASAPTT